MRIGAIVEYDGSAFSGWQRQVDARSVQAVVEEAFSKVAGEAITVTVAGRTDAGVHALAQVIHFDTNAARSAHNWVRGAVSNLPPDVAVLWADRIADDFHARYAATGRHYHYVIRNRSVRPAVLTGQVTHEYRPLNVERMQTAAQGLLGTHDFNAFRSAECQAKHAVRELRALEISRRGEYVVIHAYANAFLHHMVRNLAGVLIAIGAGERAPDWAREVLDSCLSDPGILACGEISRQCDESMRTRVKICGITRVEDGVAAAEAGADAIGLVFVSKSPRLVSISRARAIADALPPFVTVVGLFVDAVPDRVRDALNDVRIDLLQFHGNEEPGDCRGFQRPYIKAIAMRDDVDVVAEVTRFTDAAGLLLDAYVAGKLGGTGQKFDWTRVPPDLKRPIILAGGLSPANVASAVEAVHPYAVDVSTGVELSKGIKDPKKIRAFIQAVRSAE